ncbi:MAG: galactokinase [Deltaproteobacteria bacterium]|nr:galactokinase [Deltaproteobacteria bacterium]
MPPTERHDEALCTELEASFTQRFGRTPEFVVRAPGRVNLIGEHTDYNGGWVLPCAIDRHTAIAGAPRNDGRIRIHSREMSGDGAPAEVRPEETQAPAGDWVDYLRGAVVMVAEETGRIPPGLDLAVASDVPGESGLSSSAAFGVALVTALERALRANLGPEARGRLAHRSESEFVGVPCGIMDQYASALGRRDHALQIDCRSREVVEVPLPGESLRILVADSGVRRRLATGQYGDRKAECEAACAAAAGGLAGPGRAAPDSLRDIEAADLTTLEPALDPILFRRLRHVVTENARVHAFRTALDASDFVAAGRILREGQQSLRNDFEVSIEELDTLCEAGDTTPGIYGSRLTGAGFGGCTVHLVDQATSSEAAEAIADKFEQRYGRRPRVFEVTPADGAEVLS